MLSHAYANIVSVVTSTQNAAIISVKGVTIFPLFTMSLCRGHGQKILMHYPNITALNKLGTKSATVG